MATEEWGSFACRWGGVVDQVRGKKRTLGERLKTPKISRSTVPRQKTGKRYVLSKGLGAQHVTSKYYQARERPKLVRRGTGFRHCGCGYSHRV